MIRLNKSKIFFIFLFLFGGCSNVLQTIDLKVSTKDETVQEEFNVIQKTLTLAEAYAQNSSVYPRFLMQNGQGQEARVIPENVIQQSSLPPQLNSSNYLIGAGDVLRYSRLLDNQLKDFNKNSQWPPRQEIKRYKLGIGDELALRQIVEITTPLIMGSSDEGDDFSTIVH